MGTRNFILIITFFLSSLIACNDYGSIESYPSPNGKYIIDIQEEYQLGNDPDPIWQHISIRNWNEKEMIFPGNLYYISVNGKTKISWKSNDHVIIYLDGTYGNSFEKDKIKSKAYEKINIEPIFRDDVRK